MFNLFRSKRTGADDAHYGTVTIVYTLLDGTKHTVVYDLSRNMTAEEAITDVHQYVMREHGGMYYKPCQSGGCSGEWLACASISYNCGA